MTNRLVPQLPALLSLLAATVAGADPVADWPTYSHDNARTGITSQELHLPLREAWRYDAAHPPAPAWPSPAENDYWHNHRKLRPVVTYDRAFHPVIADGTLFFGSSADDKVYALDARTGEELWSFFTGGPVRLAPVVAAGKVYAGSDDGAVYSLDARSGKLLWKFTAHDPQRCVPGNGRMISKWPIRAGLVVMEGNVYFGAGLFPKEGTYLFALDAETGVPLWKQQVQFSLQGYMLASPERLYVPTGRAHPVVFSRADGSYLGELGSGGGAYALLADDVLVTGPGRGERAINADDVKTRETIASFDGLRMVIHGKTAYVQSETKISAFDCGRYLLLAGKKNDLDKQTDALKERLKKLPKTADEAESKKLQKELDGVEAELGEIVRAMKACYLWTVNLSCPYSLVLAGNTLLAGGDGKIVALGSANGREIWSAPVDGRAYGVSLAGGRLYVSTDKGILHCFSTAGDKPSRIPRKSSPRPDRDDARSAWYGRVVEHLLGEAGDQPGYCLVLGCEQGQLALEIARRTALHVICVEDDALKVAAARRRLDKAGVYGTRVTVHQRSLDRLPYPDYFANWIVSERTLVKGTLPESLLEIFRVLRPFGGTAYIGQPADGQPVDGQPSGKLTEAKLASWLRQTPVPGATISKDDGLWATVVGSGDPPTTEATVVGSGDPPTTKATVVGSGDPPTTEDTTISKDDGLWARIRRGPLPGGGQWTQLYATAGNTASNGDLLRGPMTIQWFGEPGPRHILDRHHRPMSPLFAAGRLFVPGDNRVTAMDAYNGSLLWHLEVPDSRRIGVMKDCGQMVATDRVVFIAAGDECWGIDARNGTRLQTYKAPLLEGAQQEWGYLNAADGRIFGSAQTKGASFNVMAFHGNPRNACEILEGDFREVILSHDLFALDENTSTRKWLYRKGAIMNSTITMGSGRIFFVECRDPAVVSDADGRIRIDRFCKQQVFLVALDAKTGAMCWERSVRLPFQHILFLSCAGNTLVCSGSYNDGNRVQYGLFTFQADTGEDLWETHYLAMDIDGTKPSGTKGSHGEQWQHPVINGSTIYSKPHAFDLSTGAKLPYQWFRGGHGCGGISSSERYLFGRGSNPRYYPLDADRSAGIRLTEVTRPGCWINIIPAGGIVLIPESSSGCTCEYAVQTSLAFAPRTYYGPPYFLTRARVFQETLRVALASSNGCGEIRYTLDGSEPTRQSPLYSDSLPLTKTTTIKARAFWGNERSSDVVQAEFIRR